MDWAMAGTSLADMATTEWALTKPGLAEGNPFMQEPVVRIGLKTVGTAGVIALTHHLKKKGKKRAAKILGITACVLWGGAAVHNAIQIRRNGGH